MSFDRAQGALSGIRVVDMSRLFPGPYCTQLLADMGAEIIKIEDMEGGDYLRHFPPLCADGQSAMFHSINRGKKSVMLNLKDEQGRADLLLILATADVLLESFRPGVLAKLGLGYDSLKQRFPRLVVCSISGYGQTGPLAARAGHDLNYVALSGALARMKSPMPLPVQAADLMGGAWPAALQIVTALYARDRSIAAGAPHNSGGVYIDVGMSECVRHSLSMSLAAGTAERDASINGADMLNGFIPAYDVYATKDGHLAIGALEPKFWVPFVKAVGLPHLADSGSDRDNKAAVSGELQAVLSQHSTGHWIALLKRRGIYNDVCVEPVLTHEQARTHEQNVARGGDLKISIRKPGGGAPSSSASASSSASSSSSTSSSSSSGEATVIHIPRPPLRMLGVVPSRAQGPGLGEHNRAVLDECRVRADQDKADKCYDDAGVSPAAAAAAGGARDKLRSRL